MNIIEEIEIARTRAIAQINYDFDELIAKVNTVLSKSLSTVPAKQKAERAFDREIPLSIGAGYFKGEKPIEVKLPSGQRVQVSNWKKLVGAIMEDCNRETVRHQKLMGLRGRISGRERTLLAATPQDMRSPLRITDDIYMETHYDTESLLRVLTEKILANVGYDYSGITITIKNN